MRTITPYIPLLLSLGGVMESLADSSADTAPSAAGGSASSYHQMLITEAGGPEVLQWTQRSPLPQPGPGQVRIKVLTASASFTDVMVRKGLYRGIEAELPYPPGYDMVGIVDALGEGVSDLQIGQRVADLTVYGAYTEYMLRAAEGLVTVPPDLPSDEAVVLVLAYLTAYQMIFRVAEVAPEQRVLIHGASGAVGTALAQLGRVAGLEMYGTASTGKQDYVRDLGVTPIDYKTEDFVERVMSYTDGEGVDVVFDAIGVDNFARSYQVLNPDGLLVKYGLYRTTLQGSGSGALGWEFLKVMWQQKMWDWFPSDNRRATFYSIQAMREAHPDWFRDDMRALFELAVEQNIDPHIWRTLPLRDAAEAHRLIESGEVRGKIVLRVSDEPLSPESPDSDAPMPGPDSP